ncbi:hypothetical protein B9J78_03000 [bacterium Unc6]|nr:hypothetical protein [bacterium Unc6]
MLNSRQRNKKQKNKPYLFCQTGKDIAMDYAVRLLSVRQRSEIELSDRLVKRIKDKNTVQDCIKKLKSLGYIDDKKFAKDWIEERLRKSPRSFSALRYELTGFGISKNIIDDVLDEFSRELSDLDIAKGLIKEKAQAQASIKEKAYWIRFLIQKGFSYETAEEAIIKGVVKE